MRILSVQNVWAMVMILMVLWGTTRWKTAAYAVVQERQLERTGILEDINMRDNVETCYTCEIAKLDDGSIIYGSVQEIEEWVQANDPRWVTDYLDHMSPAHVQKFGKYVGKSLTDPYSVGGTHSRKMDYDLGRIVVTEKI